jgi:hypothetical protein
MPEWNQDDADTAAMASLCFLLAAILVIVALLTACTTNVAPIKLPEKECKRLDMPPLPQKAVIRIDGSSIDVDEGGSQVIRNYVAARNLLK